VFTVVPKSLPGLTRRLALELQQHPGRRERPAVESSLRGHQRIIVVITDSRRSAGDPREISRPQLYISEPGVVRTSPVSSQVLRPDKIIGQPP